MPSLIEDYAYIAQRAREIRAARYRELGVSPPGPPPGQPAAEVPESPDAPTCCDGFRYASGFEHLAHTAPTTGH
jgi:hypothetical protein